MATHTIRTTIRPDLQVTVDEAEYLQLLQLGLIYSGAAPVGPADFYDGLLADKIANGVATPAALKAALVSKGTTSPAATLSAGTEYVWMKTDGAGTLLDIVSGVA